MIKPLLLLFVLLNFSLSACTPPSTSYRLLSDEVISKVKSPPYSLEQVKQAQASLRWRISNRLREVNRESELKSFACLMVSQQLDPTSARGDQAPSRVPCIAQSNTLCSHGCKRSRLSRKMILPPEYDEIAKRHDEIIWTDLQAIAPREPKPPWDRYLTDCLACERSLEIKRLICERDLVGIDLTMTREPYTPLDRWLNQCETLSDPKIQALISFRSFMLTPPEDLPYPALIHDLPQSLQDQLTERAMLGEGERLVVSALDPKRISALLKLAETTPIKETRWSTLKEQLQRRLDVELMPCLEHGMETCLTTGQIRLTLRQAPSYLQDCKLCEYQEVVRSWLDQVALGVDSLWHSHHTLSTQTLLRRSTPAALIIREQGMVSKLSLERVSSEERLIWSRLFIKEKSQGSLKLWELQAGWNHYQEPPPHLILSDHRQLYAVDHEQGVTRWSYRFPLSEEGELIPCERVEPIPANQIGNSLSQGGALCYRQGNILFLNALGEQTLNLSCPELGCGEFFALTANHAHPFKATLTLFMKHPELNEKGELNGYTLTTYDLSQLDLMTSEVIQREANERDQKKWTDLLDVSWALDTATPSILVTSQEANKTILHLIDAQSGQVKWKTNIKGLKLLQEPSVRIIQGIDDRGAMGLVGILTDLGLSLISLDGGELVRYEQLKLNNRLSPKELLQARRTPLAWELLGDQLTLLHSLNHKLYFSTDQSPLAKRSLSFEHLDPQSTLGFIYDQWVVTSPQYGQVFGVTPQGNKIAWSWQVTPFLSLHLGPRWALFKRTHSDQLSTVFPLSPEEMARTPKDRSVNPSTDKSQDTCALGDRWRCFFEGDELIKLSADLNRRDRIKQAKSWFNMEKSKLTQVQRVETNNKSDKSDHIKTFDGLTEFEAQRAYILWKSACEWGIASACTRLGMLAELGLTSEEIGVAPNGVPKYREALRHYQRAKELNDPLASERLGEMYEEGRGGPQDYSQARISYLNACEQSIPSACARWGRLNELGLGGPQKLTTAQAAYQRACKANVQWACELITD